MSLKSESSSANEMAKLLEKKLNGITRKETYLRDAPFACPECGGLVKRYKGSTVSNSIDAFACTACLWFGPACGNRDCESYMSGSSVSGYSTTVQWRCTSCGWSGMGYLMVAPGLPFGSDITVDRTTGKTPLTVYSQMP